MDEQKRYQLWFGLETSPVRKTGGIEPENWPQSFDTLAEARDHALLWTTAYIDRCRETERAKWQLTPHGPDIQPDTPISISGCDDSGEFTVLIRDTHQEPTRETIRTKLDALERAIRDVSFMARPWKLNKTDTSQAVYPNAIRLGQYCNLITREERDRLEGLGDELRWIASSC
jgi:hypothetical protein